MNRKSDKILLTNTSMTQNLIINWDEDWEPLPEISGSMLGTFLIVSAISGLVASIISYIYIQYFLRVNKINKVLLRWYAIEHIMCFTAVTVGHMILPIFQNIWTCFFSFVPIKILYYLSTNAAMSISGIRYYIKYKAQKSQSVNPKQVINFIKYNKMSCYLIIIIGIVLCFLFRFKVGFFVCANEETEKSYIGMIYNYSVWLSSLAQILISIVCEVKLKYLFNERRNDGTGNQPDSLAPWRAIGANLETNKIPQKSACISICWMLIMISIMTCSQILMKHGTLSSDVNILCTWSIIVTILVVFHLPMILIFTFNHNFNLRFSQRQPPSELQFYDTAGDCKIQFPDNQSNQAEYSVDPRRQVGVFTINTKSSAPKYEVDRDAMVDEPFHVECHEEVENYEKNFFDIVSHCQQLSDEHSEGDEYSVHEASQISTFPSDVKNTTTKDVVKSDKHECKESFLSEEAEALEEMFLDMIANSSVEQFSDLGL